MTLAPTFEVPFLEAPDEEPDPPRRPWTVRRVVGLLVLASLVAGAAGGVWWFRHPEPVFTGSYGMRTVEKPGETMWTAIVERAESGQVSPVRLTGLEPVFAGGEQTAWIDYLVCDLDRRALKQHGGDGFGYGGDDREIERLCARTAPAEGATFPAPDGRPQALIVGITRSQPGVTRVSGHRISFRDGWQWGTDDVAVSSRVTVRK